MAIHRFTADRQPARRSHGHGGRAPSDPSYRAFIDGLRDCLGLDPIYAVDERPRPDVDRFYVGTRSESVERTPIRGAP